MQRRRAPQPHKIWKVDIGSVDDEHLRDRVYFAGSRSLATYKLPVRGTYIIEAKGQGRVATKKALRLATQDGITRPIVLSLLWLNNPYGVGE
jgi:hypothetical protein